MSDRISRLDVDLVVVTFTKERNLKGYQRRFAPGAVVVTDPSRRLYQHFQFGRASTARIWGWKSMRRYGQLLRQGHRLQLRDIDNRGEDLNQLGGNVVVSADGIVRWVYQGTGPDDRPSVDQVLEQLTLVEHE